MVKGYGIGLWCMIMSRAMGRTMAKGYDYGHGLELRLRAMV